MCHVMKKSCLLCADSESFVRGVQLIIIQRIFVLFLVDEGREDPLTTKSGPSLACQQNTIIMAFRWWGDDGPTLNECWFGSFVII